MIICSVTLPTAEQTYYTRTIRVLYALQTYRLLYATQQLCPHTPCSDFPTTAPRPHDHRTTTPPTPCSALFIRCWPWRWRAHGATFLHFVTRSRCSCLTSRCRSRGSLGAGTQRQPGRGSPPLSCTCASLGTAGCAHTNTRRCPHRRQRPTPESRRGSGTSLWAVSSSRVLDQRNGGRT